MNKALKIIGITIGAIFALIVSALLAIYLFFDPNDYKDEIAARASEKLGHELSFQGPVDIKIFPWLGMNAENVTIVSSNSVSDKTLATVGKLSFKVKTWPLLKRDVQVDKIVLSDANIQLVRNKQGQTNWEPKPKAAPAQSSETEATEAASTSPEQTESSAPQQPFGLMISGIELEKSQVVFDDQKANQLFDFSDLSFKTGKIKQDTPIDVAGHFALHMKGEETLENVTDFSMTLEWGLASASLKEVVLTTELTSKKLPVSPMKAELTGQAALSILKSNLVFSDITLKLDDSTAKGDATFTWLSGPHVDFNVHVDKINADKYIAALPSDSTQVASAAQANNNDSPFKHTAATPASLTYKGDIKLDKLSAKGLNFSQINMTAQNHSKGMMLKPFSANLYNGSFKGESLVNFSNQSTSLIGRLSSVDMGPLLKAVSGKPHLTGTGNADVNLVVGKSGLNGSTKLAFSNGFIEGVDLDYYMKTARLQLKQLDAFLGDPDLEDLSSDKVSDRKRTDYDSITATILANNNVLTNSDLKLNSNDLAATGDGSIDLNKEYISYKFTAKRIYNDGKKHPNALPLSVRVKGPFNNIKIMPDIDAYIQAMIKQKAEGAVIEKLDKALGGDGADSIEDAIEDRLNKEIDKGIKKIFKF